MKSLRTKDTKEWCNLTPDGSTFYLHTHPFIFGKGYENLYGSLLNEAERETEHPCEWVNISIAVEGEAVVVAVQEVPDGIKPRAFDLPSDTYSNRGWINCMRHYGFLKEGGQK